MHNLQNNIQTINFPHFLSHASLGPSIWLGDSACRGYHFLIRIIIDAAGSVNAHAHDNNYFFDDYICLFVIRKTQSERPRAGGENGRTAMSDKSAKCIKCIKLPNSFSINGMSVQHRRSDTLSPVPRLSASPTARCPRVRFSHVMIYCNSNAHRARRNKFSHSQRYCRKLTMT